MLNILSSLFYSGSTVDVDDKESLIGTGRVDSLDMMELVSTLEKEFSIKVDIDDLLPENFDTVNGICKYLASK